MDGRHKDNKAMVGRHSSSSSWDNRKKDSLRSNHRSRLTLMPSNPFLLRRLSNHQHFHLLLSSTPLVLGMVKVEGMLMDEGTVLVLALLKRPRGKRREQTKLSADRIKKRDKLSTLI